MTLRRATSADFDAVVALQHAAYAPNQVVLGVLPIPLQADYVSIFKTLEVWLAESPAGLDGVLILEPRTADLLIWSIATEPARPHTGLGRDMLAWAEVRARQLGCDTMRLYTGTVFTQLVHWYGRHGNATEHIEQMPDRSAKHMIKRL